LNGSAAETTQTNSSVNFSFVNVAAGSNYELTPAKPSYVFQPFSQGGSGLDGDRTLFFTGAISSNASSIQFSANNFSTLEDNTAVIISVTRSGDTSGGASVEYATSDSSATQRSNYTIASGTLTFASGETIKTFNTLINEENYVKGSAQVVLTLSNPTNTTGSASLGIPSVATVTISDNDTVNPPTSNVIDDARDFVYQHYHDFLSREPDAGGLAYWTSQITECGDSNPLCVHSRRVAVSNAFFYEQEFQETGAYVYRIYKAAFSMRPTYAQFMPDRSRVIGGTELDQSKTDFANNSVQRNAFLTVYPITMTAAQYVDALNANTGNSLTQSQRDTLVTGMQGSTETRGSVLRKIADNQAFIDREYSASFVLTEYFGYLRRDPDQDGFDFWLGQVDRFPIRDVGIQHAMVCSFITSAEYQQRFSSVVTHTNNECPQ